jgi:hypothetical protein
MVVKEKRRQFLSDIRRILDVNTRFRMVDATITPNGEGYEFLVCPKQDNPENKVVTKVILRRKDDSVIIHSGHIDPAPLVTSSKTINKMAVERKGFPV